jgi:hypothetical protein
MGKAVPVEQLLEESRRLRDQLSRLTNHVTLLAEDLLEKAADMREEAGLTPRGAEKESPNGNGPAEP